MRRWWGRRSGRCFEEPWALGLERAGREYKDEGIWIEKDGPYRRVGCFGILRCAQDDGGKKPRLERWQRHEQKQRRCGGGRERVAVEKRISPLRRSQSA